MKKHILSVLAMLMLAVVLATAKSVIMKIEFKDGTVKYIDTEDVVDFSITQLDDLPQANASATVTTTEWESAYLMSAGYVNDTIDGMQLNVSYSSADPSVYQYTIKAQDKNSSFQPITFSVADTEFTVPCQPAGITDPVYGEIWLAGKKTYAKVVAGDQRYPIYSDGNTSTVDIGNIKCMELKLVYYAPYYEGDTPLESQSTSTIIESSACDVNLEVLGVCDYEKYNQLIYNVSARSYVGKAKTIRGAYKLIDYTTNTISTTDLAERVAAGDYDFDLPLDGYCLITTVVPETSVCFAMVYESVDCFGHVETRSYTYYMEYLEPDSSDADND